MDMNPQEKRNWDYLVASVENPQGTYINAKSKRYAAAISAADKKLRELLAESQRRLASSDSKR